MPAPDTSGTVTRTLAVLTAVAESGGSVGVTDIATAVGLPMSTTHRLLDLLREAGFVEKDGSRRRYSAGLEFLRVASLIAQNTSFAKLCQPSLDRIAAETGETVIFSEYLPDRHMAAYAAKCDSKSALRYQVDLFEPAPVECGASGKAILSALPEPVRSRICDNPRPSPLTGNAASREELCEQIDMAMRRGYAFSRGEKLPGSIGIAVPVRSPDGQPVGSLTLTIPESRFLRSKLKEYAALLLEEARSLSGARGS